jgi:hypothetical protein
VAPPQPEPEVVEAGEDWDEVEEDWDYGEDDYAHLETLLLGEAGQDGACFIQQIRLILRSPYTGGLLWERRRPFGGNPPAAAVPGGQGQPIAVRAQRHPAQREDSRAPEHPHGQGREGHDRAGRFTTRHRVYVIVFGSEEPCD